MTFVGIGCATIAGLDEDFERAPECDSILPPAAPKISNAGDTIDFAAAIRTVDLDEGDENPRFGYDLDGQCSCTLDGSSCNRPAFVAPEEAVCDDARGLDNGAGKVFAEIKKLPALGISSVAISEGATQGLWTLMIGVRDFSGTANDDHVTVALYETPGLAMPSWAGTDVWPVANTSVGPAGTVDDPIHVDKSAYVSNGVLVAHIPQIRLLFRGSSLQMPIDLVAVTLTAKIVEATAGNWRLTEGTLAGRWPLTSIFENLSVFRYGADLMSKFCRDDFAYLQVKGAFCAATDIHANPSASSSTDCDAISFGMRFETESMRLGAVTNPLPPPEPLCGIGFEPSTDSCVKVQ